MAKESTKTSHCWLTLFLPKPCISERVKRTLELFQRQHQENSSDRQGRAHIYIYIPSWTDLCYKDQMHGTNLSSNLALISRRALFFKPGSRKASLLMTDFSKLMSTEYLQCNKQTTNQKLKHFLDCVPQEKSSTHLVIMLLAAMKECRPIMDLI